MKMDADCIRDILLLAEDCPADHYLTMTEMVCALPQHDKTVIDYNCYKLHEGGFIIAVTYPNGGYVPSVVSIADITFDGHQFLAKIRDEDRWKKIKTCRAALRDYSLSALASIAQGITAAFIGDYFSGKTFRA